MVKKQESNENGEGGLGYTVFTKNIVTNEWRLTGTSQASNRDSAVRDVAGDQEGVFAAVPTRSWHPVVIEKTVITTTRLVSGEQPSQEEQSEELS